MSLTDLPTTSPKTLSLAGKTAIISNSSNSAKIARELAQNGANVAFHNVSSTSSSKERAEKLALGITSEFGTKTTVVQGSVKNYSNAKTVIEQILKGFGVDHIDILVNNKTTTNPEVNTDQLEYEFAANVFDVIYMTQAVVGVGRMPPSGRIINLGSNGLENLGNTACIWRCESCQ